jgi:DNA polymerase elongation subunit (family B)
MRGFLLDVHADHRNDRMVLWIRRGKRSERLEDPGFRPCMHVHHGSAAELRRLASRLSILDCVGSAEMARKRLDLGSRKARGVLAVRPRHYSEMADCAGTIDCMGGYHDYRLYDVDVRYSQRYMVGKGIFPLALVDTEPEPHTGEGQYRVRYRVPGLSSVELELGTGSKFPRADTPIAWVRAGGMTLDGPEDGILADLGALVWKLDPDIIYTRNGDSFEMPHLMRRAAHHGIDLQLGREPQHPQAGRKGRSYFSYGNILYKPPSFTLLGRLHIDMSSFMFSEGGLHGLVDMARLSSLPIQTTARISPGSAITAMQVQLAMRDGCAIAWKKNRPEDFKTAEELLLADRGGMIFEPEVGIHEGVLEVDFVSMYPNIMVSHNISPETLNCACCPDSANTVPELGYRTCEKVVGLIPRVVAPLVGRRLAYKAMAKACGPDSDMYKKRSSLLKWTLVTCFGYTGYKNARFGRIECHESINAYGREILLQTMELAEKFGYEVLHGIIDSLWLKPTGRIDHAWFCESVSKAVGIPLEPEGVYRWVIFLPSKQTGEGALNRYYGLFEGGEYKVRGIFLRKSDTPELLRKAQRDMLEVFRKASGAADFRELIPTALESLRAHAERVRGGDFRIEELVMSKRVSHSIEEYRQSNDQLAALRQLHDAGVTLLPGQRVRYVICDSGSPDYRRKVKAADLLEGDERCDAERYLEMLARAGEDLLSPFGWTEERVAALLKKRGL